MSTYLGSEDILTGPENFKGRFGAEDIILMLRLINMGVSGDL